MTVELSVVIPAFNEEHSIRQSIVEVMEHVSPQVSTCEIVVVDDGSTDDTGRILDDIATTNSSLRVVRRHNGGHGPAILTGMRVARGEKFLLLDADREISLEDFHQHWRAFQGHDAVLGYRVGRSNRGLRSAVSFGMRGLIQALFGVSPRDANAPFKLFRARDWQAAARFIGDNNAIPSAMLAVHLLASGRSVVERGVMFRPRQGSRSTLNLRRLSSLCCRAVWSLVQFRINLSKERFGKQLSMRNS
jgi:glycosyltransferase involved in cell wall biosynthesis